MNNRVYKYFFYEFLRYFFTVLFAIAAIIWTIQAVNYLDLITEDGHAFAEQSRCDLARYHATRSARAE